MISCGARLAVFDIAELREVTSYDELELDTLGDRKTALFLIMSDTDDSFNFLISMCYTQLFNLLCTSECGTPRRWSSQGGDEQSCFGAIYDFTKRMVADPARGLHGGLKILPHGLLKTWGEPCGARVKRRCGVMTTAPAETCYVPIVRVAWQM